MQIGSITCTSGIMNPTIDIVSSVVSSKAKPPKFCKEGYIIVKAAFIEVELIFKQMFLPYRSSKAIAFHVVMPKVHFKGMVKGSPTPSSKALFSQKIWLHGVMYPVIRAEVVYQH